MNAKILGAAIAMSLTVGGSAHAYISDSNACGSAPAAWNAPNGSLVASRSVHGPISSLMDAIGEYYSHQMVSHGTIGWLSHATMKTPGVSIGVIWPFNDDQVEGADLKYGWPGASQVNMGAGYWMLYRDGTASTAAYWYDGGTDGARTADWLWGTGSSYMPSCNSVSSGPCWTGATSEQNSGQSFYLIARKGYNGDSNVYRHGYGFYQYQDSKSVTTGDDTSAIGWGQHCSTLVAWGLAKATGKTISTKTYSNSVVNPATQTLHNSISADCSDTAGWLGGIFVNCDDIADQVTNCFTAQNANDLGRCDDDHESTWQNWRSTGTARSISPDRAVGRAMTNGTSNNGGGPWAGKPANSLQWNSGGSVYGCFF